MQTLLTIQWAPILKIGIVILILLAIISHFFIRSLNKVPTTHSLNYKELADKIYWAREHIKDCQDASDFIMPHPDFEWAQDQYATMLTDLTTMHDWLIYKHEEAMKKVTPQKPNYKDPRLTLK